MPTPTTNQPTTTKRLRDLYAQLERQQVQLDRRWRFEVALVALTIIGTVAFMFIIGAPPVTYNPANVCTGSL
ncbi:hypothetical protein NQ028_09195 [Corynebacterium phoceense]|uniref:hypothetical protein n=1 Tax=Corynebacterium phoceense TaxID=1686286 RepID=UPI00211BE466|nr:hypothetical protein [Corynebacterium phoceense]MCQ9341310.1 hypothetical protein [Corynebacterium phoceense]